MSSKVEHTPIHSDIAYAESIIAEHTSLWPTAGFGRTAVQSILLHQEVLHNAAEIDPSILPLDVETDEAYETYTAPARMKLETLSSDDKDSANLFLRYFGIDDGLKSILKEENLHKPGFDIVGLLTAKKEDGSYKIGARSFANFLEGHNYILNKEQLELNERLVELKSGYAADVCEAVAEGWIPQTAVGNLTHLDDALVVLDDGFDTSMRGASGYLTKGYKDRDVIVMSPLYRHNSRQLLAHEFTHAINGRDDQALGTSNTEGLKTSRGMYRIFGEEGGYVIDEAVVEHIASSLVHGEVDETDPSADVRRNDVYVQNRELLHTLVAGGIKPVDIRLFIAAHFENQTQREFAEAQGLESAQAQLVRKLREAFPTIDVVQAIRGMPQSDRDFVERFNQIIKDELSPTEPVSS